jgi:hypothetical protein
MVAFAMNPRRRIENIVIKLKSVKVKTSVWASPIRFTISGSMIRFARHKNGVEVVNIQKLHTMLQ